MNFIPGYTRGIGIGGWLTNYKRIAVLPEEKRMDVTIGDFEHFDSYITEWDVKNIASFGVDHIRLAFDQIVLEEFDNPYHYRDCTFRHIDDFLGWAKKYGLNVILNLHKAVGCYCDCPGQKPLLETPEYRDRFKALWLEFERRYHDYGHEIMFELMNEITDSESDKWNSLWHETAAEIRKLNPDRLIMIGSASWNSVDKLSDLDVVDDPNIVYTFHFYSPHEFTHQRGLLTGNHWYNRDMPWPCDIKRYRECAEFMYGNKNAYPEYDEMGKKFIYDHLAPAKKFLSDHPSAVLTCGEFGTIRSCPVEWRENWFADVIGWLDENEIPFTIWNYLSTPYDGNRFSLVDDDRRQPVSDKIFDMIRIK